MYRELLTCKKPSTTHLCMSNGVAWSIRTIVIHFPTYIIRFSYLQLYSGQGLTTLLSPVCFLLNMFYPFTWSIPNLVQGLHSMSRWSLLIFRSRVQRSRSNLSSQPTVLSAQYLLTPSLDQYQNWCRGCPQWVDDPYWFSGHTFKGQGQTTLLNPLCCLLNIFWPLHLINTKRCRGCAQ